MFVTSLTAGISNVMFPESYYANGSKQHDSFSEQRVDVGLFGEYRLSNTFGLNATVNYDQNITGVVIKADPMDPGGDALAYRRWQAFLGARWFL